MFDPSKAFFVLIVTPSASARRRGVLNLCSPAVPARPRRSARSVVPALQGRPATRISASPMPAASRAACVMRPCVVVAGCVIVVFTSPRLPVMDMIFTASTTFHACGLAALDVERQHRAAARLLPLRQRHRRVRREEQDSSRSPPSDAPPATLPAPARSRYCARMPDRQRLHTLQNHPCVERSKTRARGTQEVQQTRSRHISSCPQSRHPSPAPVHRGAWTPNESPHRRPAPVAAAAPGVQKQLSTAKVAPTLRAISAIAAMSKHICHRVRWRFQEHQFGARVGSPSPHASATSIHHLAGDAELAHHRCAEHIERGTEHAATGDDVVARRASVIASVEIAAMPVAVAIAASAPSIAAGDARTCLRSDW